MTITERDEYAEKSGLTPGVIQDALRDTPEEPVPVLLVHQKLDQYAKAVCREVFGNDFAKHIRVVIDVKRRIEHKYGWEIGE